ncbi:MAG: hypothetical protein CMK74_12260 [Pseudomonadales bacterium]|nr:hypothetical protein [Pseudomonadales bacterium]
MKPDASNHNPDPAYLRGLRYRTGLSQKELAQRLGMSRRLIQYYEAPEDSEDRRVADYRYQYCLEQLAKGDDQCETSSQ